MSTNEIPQPDNSQYIKLPDGSYGKFSSDATDDVIKGAISKDFPQAYAPENQSSALMRFIKAGAGQYLKGTLNAGPQQAGARTQDFSQAEADVKAGRPSWSFSDSSLSNIPGNAIQDASQLNPIDMQRFKSGDIAGGLGSSAMNLIMLRKGLQQARGGNVAEYGSPAANAEIAQPLTGGTNIEPQAATPLKATTPAAAQAEILKNIGVAAPRATGKPMTSIPPATLTPSANLSFANAGSGEEAAMQQLMRYDINQLRGIAMQRGLKVAASTSQSKLVNMIGDNLTDDEINAFDQARTERMQPNYGQMPEKIGPRVPASDADMMNLLMQSIKSRARAAGND